MSNHWLIVYSRRDSRLLRCDEYGDDSHRAILDRFQWERRFVGLDVEVVVLGANSLDDLKRTHGRYFANASALLSKRTQEG